MMRPNIRKLIKQVFRSYIQRDNCLENKFIQYPGPNTFQFNDLISTIMFFVISVNSFLNIPKDVSLRIAVTFKERDCTLNAVRFQYERK